jgi:hypothetical protein
MALACCANRIQSSVNKCHEKFFLRGVCHVCGVVSPQTLVVVVVVEEDLFIRFLEVLLGRLSLLMNKGPL